MDRVAVVGMAFRFPGGAESEKTLWDALVGGEDLVSEIDGSRWAVDTLQHPKRSEPGRSITYSAGVLSRIDEFDAGFFGVSPREAELLDPQQRILLELAWEAMEHAGVRPSSLAGTRCAVYVGMSALDYGMRLLDDLSSMGAHSMTGNTMSVAANRLSYVFDLRGPSLAIDTACSSSLVALHEACNALSSGQATAALVGGINVLLHPYPFVGFTKASMLSAQGRCRPFSEGGDGYVRAEGGAVLLLKPLSQALADGNRILAVIRASGVNADGGRKSGLTIPSVDGQTELLRDVLAKASLQPQDVDFLEAHGTGTKIGDPIEAEAIGRVYGVGRPADQPLPIGSIKGNLGHMEPASGMGGMVKAILALQHAILPPSIHADPPNPAIDFRGLGLQVARQPQALAHAGRPLRAAVNSFGFGGVNAHVILEQFPPNASAAAAPLPGTEVPVPLVLSAHDERALQALALEYLPYLSDPAQRAAVAQAAWHQRDWLPERLAVVDLGQARGLDALAAYAEGENGSDIVRERALSDPAHVAYVYSGNGAQWVGMGRVLRQASPVFAQALAQASAALQASGGPDIQAALADDRPDALDDTALAQPAMFAIQVALTQLLRSLGVHAKAASGHSVGEIAAAWAVGGLSLEAAAHVIVERSRAQALTRGAGRMAAVGMSAQAMRVKLEALDLADRIELAAENSPRNITVSAAPADLQVLREALRPAGTVYRELDLDYAFHSRFMDPVETQIKSRLAGLRAQTGAGTFYSTVTGDALDTRTLDADYWWRNVREPVRFAPALSRMIEAGYRVFIEISPHAILQRYIGEALDAHNVGGRSLAVAKRQAESLAQVQEAALRAALLGAAVDPSAYFAQPLLQHIELPRYPWQRQRYWYKATSERYALIERAPVHPLLGYRLKEFRAAWENHLDPIKQPWLAGHKVGGALVLPGAAYVDMALAASREWFGGEHFVVENLDIVSPVVFDGEHARTLRLIFTPHDLRFRIEGRQRLSDDAWSVHAQGRLLGAPAHASNPMARIIPAQEAVRVHTAAAHYALAEQLGLHYGPGFRGIARLDVGADTLGATLAWPPAHEPEAGFVLHPAVLDQAFQAVLGWFAEGSTDAPGLTFLPVGIGRLVWQGTRGAAVASLRARLVRHNPRSVLVDFELLDPHGTVLAALQGCRFRAAALRLHEKTPACWATTLSLEPLHSDPALGSLPPSGDIARAVLIAWQHSEAAAAHQRYLTEITPLVEQLPLAFARDTLRAQAADGGPPSAGTIAQWREGHPLLRWLIERLQDDGLLTEAPPAWTAAEPDLPPARAIWETVLADCPAALPELLRLGRVGMHLHKLALGHEIEAALERSRTHAILESQAPVYAFANHALVEAVAASAKRRPANRRLRILDIGGDDGTLYKRLQALVPDTTVDFVIARSNPEDLAHLQAEYGRHDRVSVAALDPLTFDLALPSGAPGAFDLVLVNQVLHRVERPARALASLQERMAPDAVLLVAEREPDQASQLLFGARAGWWHRDEAGALHGSLLDATTWERLLHEAGWTDVVAVQGEPASTAAWGSVLLIARPLQRRTEAGSLAARAPASWSLRAGHAAWQPLARALQDALRSQGQTVTAAGTECGNTADHLVLFPDLPDARASAAHVAGVCDDMRRLLLDVAAQANAPQVAIVTRGGALAGDASPAASPSAAALWGLVRVARNEYPHLRVRLIDLQLDASTALGATAERLWLELRDGGDAEEIVLASGARYAPRMRPVRLDAPAMRAQPPAAWKLDFTLAGQLRNLHWRATQRAAVGPLDVEIETRAAGLNFRDVMYTLGLLADEALEQGFAGPTLGLELSGRVVRCGAAVTRCKPGDDVLAFGGASFASHVVVPERALALKPARWTFAEAATVPTVFFTVWYALKHLADLQPGERLLVHGAAGGVGIASIQVARLLGAEVFATAGSDERRDFATLLGADHVLDSRSLGFDDAVLDLTGGEGVDVVLNSLAGEAIQRNLRALRPFGRFIELGKRDFYENTAIGLRPFRNNISYFGVDADQLMKVRPDLATRIFDEVMTLFGQGRLSPLPHRVFAADHVVDAFRTLQQSKQIGKVVIDLHVAPTSIERATPEPVFQARQDATYLITGGLSGFGLATVNWLADCGARHLALVGRRGLDTPGIGPALAALRERGVEARVFAGDVAQQSDVLALLGDIHDAMPPLRGVIHAAMVLDDALLANLDAARIERVLAPKLDGAWNLHDATHFLPLDFFVLYSSATTALGNPGQANYVGANAALEALAAQRRSQGLPACVAAWGPIADVGVLTTNAAAREGLEARLGAAAITAAQALEALGRMLVQERSGLAVMNFQWGSLQRTLPSARDHRFDDLRRLLDAGPADAGDLDLRAHLAQLGPDAARQFVTDALAAEVAEILRLPAERLGADQSLFDLGMDSLMAVELATALERRFGVTLPSMLISENPSVARIAERLLANMSGQQDEPADATSQLVQSMLAQHDEADQLPQVDAIVADIHLTAHSGTRLIQ